MKPRQLILGSGVTAGLAANLLSTSYDTRLVWSHDVMISPIPELLPRRIFFDALGVTKDEEALAVAEVAPRLQEVIWIDDGVRSSRPLVSTDTFLVYEKSRLAAWLRWRSIAAGIESEMLGKPSKITDFDNYQLVLDCRGCYAVAEDPNYEITREAQARTHCTYAILDHPETVSTNQMVFWSNTNSNGMLQTFFCVPVGNDAISVGCSYSPTMQVDINTVLAAARDFGLSVSTEHVRFSGKAIPHIDTATALTARVTPIGEAARRSCSLTEYGVIAALSQLLQLVGKPSLPPTALLRPTHSQIDPHIPLELFL